MSDAIAQAEAQNTADTATYGNGLIGPPEFVLPTPSEPEKPSAAAALLGTLDDVEFVGDISQLGVKYGAAFAIVVTPDGVLEIPLPNIEQMNQQDVASRIEEALTTVGSRTWEESSDRFNLVADGQDSSSISDRAVRNSFDVQSNPEVTLPRRPNLNRAHHGLPPNIGLGENAQTFQTLNRDGSVSTIKVDSNTDMRALKRRGTGPLVVGPHDFNSQYPTPADLVTNDVRPFMELPELDSNQVTGATIRQSIVGGLGEITSSNAETGSVVFQAGPGEGKMVFRYNPSAAAYDLTQVGPAGVNSRALAELGIHDAELQSHLDSIATGGTFVLHIIPVGAAADNFSQEGITSVNGWRNLASDGADLLTFGGSRALKVVGISIHSGNAIISSGQAIGNFSSGNTEAGFGNLGEVILRSIQLHGAVGRHRADPGELWRPRGRVDSTLRDLGPVGRNISAWNLNQFRTNSTRFYTVQGADDAARLLSTGQPWPTGAFRAQFGPGVYSWNSRVDAAEYLSRIRKRASDARILNFRVGNQNLETFRRLKVDDLVDPEGWLEQNSLIWGGATRHGLQYIQRGTDVGVEHYFSDDIFIFLVF